MRIAESQLRRVIRKVISEQIESQETPDPKNESLKEKAFAQGFPTSGFSRPEFAGLKKYLGPKKYAEYFTKPRDVVQSWTCAYAPGNHPVWGHIPGLAKSYQSLVDAFNSGGPDSPAFKAQEKRHQDLVAKFNPDLQAAIKADKKYRAASDKRYKKSMQGVRTLGDDRPANLPPADIGGPLYTTIHHAYDPYSGYHGSTSQVQNREMTAAEYDNYLWSGGR